jgi:hypothetical protein
VLFSLMVLRSQVNSQRPLANDSLGDIVRTDIVGVKRGKEQRNHKDIVPLRQSGHGGRKSPSSVGVGIEERGGSSEKVASIAPLF